MMNGPQQKVDETSLRMPTGAAIECLTLDLSVTEQPIVELLNVGKNYTNNVAIKSLTFSVEYGETIALLGRTGAGKSTVLNLIMGHIAPTSGTVRVLGVDPHKSSADLKGRMAVSFQTDCLLPWRTALQNVELGLELARSREAGSGALAQISAGVVWWHAPTCFARSRSRRQSGTDPIGRELQSAGSRDIAAVEKRFYVACERASQDDDSHHAQNRRRA